MLKEIARTNEESALDQELKDLFVDRQYALDFLRLYAEHCALVDDLVDEPGNPTTVEKAARLAYAVNNCAYWLKYRHCLYLVDRVIHNTYFDSVKWESASEEWKRRDAKCMSHCAINMILAVMVLEFGEELMQHYSIRLREYAFERHKEDII